MLSTTVHSVNSDKSSDHPGSSGFDMARLEKSRLEYFNTLLDSCKNAGFIVVGITVIIFYLFPGLSVAFREVLGQSRWYFVGTFYRNASPNAGQLAPGRYRFTDLDKGHYRNFYLGNAYDKETGEIVRGTVLMVESDVAVGRIDNGKSANPMQWPIRYVSRKYDCIHVLQWKSYDKVPEHNASLEHQSWVRAVPKTCE